MYLKTLKEWNEQERNEMHFEWSSIDNRRVWQEGEKYDYSADGRHLSPLIGDDKSAGTNEPANTGSRNRLRRRKSNH